jgi:hypothetical protein
MGAGDRPFQFWSAALDAAYSGILAWIGFSLGSVVALRIKGAR